MCQGLRFDQEFLRSKDGVFKISEFALCFIAMIALACGPYNGDYRGNFSMFVASFAFTTLLISIAIYLVRLYSLPLVVKLPWRQLEMIYALGLAVLSFLAMCMGANFSIVYSNTANAAVFAVFIGLAIPVFLYHALLLFRGWKPRSAVPDETPQPTQVNV